MPKNVAMPYAADVAPSLQEFPARDKPERWVWRDRTVVCRGAACKSTLGASVMGRVAAQWAPQSYRCNDAGGAKTRYKGWPEGQRHRPPSPRALLRGAQMRLNNTYAVAQKGAAAQARSKVAASKRRDRKVALEGPDRQSEAATGATELREAAAARRRKAVG